MYRIGSALLAIALFLPLAVFARSNDSRSVVIPSRVVVAGHQLKPGHYKLEWNQPGPKVEVSFVRQGKTVATAPATLQTNDAQVKQDDIITRKTASNQNRLTEIDFGHQKEAILFARQS